jgi:hypothetical protein
VNVDLSLGDCPNKSRYPWLLSLSTKLNAVDLEGFPNKQEAAELNAWEDMVEEKISASASFKYVGRVTWNGHRELLYYLDSPEAAVESLQSLIDQKTTRPFAFRCQRDDGWHQVRVYLQA